MSDDNVIVHRSGGVLRRRASTLNALAFALLATPLVVGALSSAWWTSALQAPTRSQMVLMMWVGAAGAAMAGGGLALAAGGAILHAIADSQDAAAAE